MARTEAEDTERLVAISAAVETALLAVRALRFGGELSGEVYGPLRLPRIEDGPVFALEVLGEVRQRMDAVEERLATATAFRSQLHREHADAAGTADDAWAAAVADTGPARGRASFGESAPRERYAAADMRTLEHKRAQRRAQSALDHISAAVETIRTAHFGLDKFRQDVHLVVRAMVVENSLER